MTTKLEPTPNSEDKSFARLLLAVGLVGVLVVGPLAVKFHLFYPLCALLTLVTGLILWLSRQALVRLLRTHQRPLMLLILPALWLQVHLPGDWQDWEDETPQAAGALKVYYDREAIVPTLGVFDLPEAPVLVGEGRSAGPFACVAGLLHDVTGQRPGNVRALNALLGYALLVSLWFGLRRMAGVGATVVVVALLVTTPLVSLVARGGGDQLWLTTLSVLLLTIEMGPQTSPIRRMVLILLTFVTAITAASLFHTQAGTGGLSLEEAFENTLYRLFSLEPQEAGSPVLMLAGVVAGLLLLMSLRGPVKAGETVSSKALLGKLFGLATAGLVVSLLQETDAETSWHSPHTLILHVAAALALGWALGRREREKPLPWKWLAPVLLFALMLWGMPRITEPVSALCLRLDGRRVLRDFAWEQPKHIPAFYVLDRPEGLIAEGISAGRPEALTHQPGSADLPPLLASRLFYRYFLLTTATRRPQDGSWVPDAWQKLPEGWVTKVVRERWIGPDRKAYIHLVLKVRLKNGTMSEIPPPASGPKLGREELTRWMAMKTEETP